MNNNKWIRVQGARVNNLKNINVEIPKEKFIVITGASGSGKSSLVFDTLYQEGKRKYLESLNTNEKYFFCDFSKIDVDQIDGLCPAINIEQRTIIGNPRSTVGTLTKIYDFLQVLYSQIARPYHPITNQLIKYQTIDHIIKQIILVAQEKYIFIMAPIIQQQLGTHQEILQKLQQEGFNQCMVNNQLCFLDQIPALKPHEKHDIYLIIDCFILTVDQHHRLRNSLELAFTLIENEVLIWLEEKKILKFQKYYNNEELNFKFPQKKSIDLFSFNNSIGACTTCKGIGVEKKFDLELIINLDKSVNNGGIIPYFNNPQEYSHIHDLTFFCKQNNIPLDIPLQKLALNKLNFLMYGNDNQANLSHNTNLNISNNLSVINALNNYYHNLPKNNQRIIRWLEHFMTKKTCTACSGSRLQPQALMFKIQNLNIFELTQMPIDKLLSFISNLELTSNEKHITKLIRSEIQKRIQLLQNLGLGYLNLARSSQSLSGGETQRTLLVKQIGSQLSGILYVLDEPSIGLHPKDHQNLIKILKQIKQLGNTLLIVEHDQKTMLAADYIIELGPKGGAEGGEIVAFGSIDEIIKQPNSLTGQYLSRRKQVTLPKTTERNLKDPNRIIQIRNACVHNLKNIDIDLPLGIFTVVTGVSGSGKSTLINHVLLNGLKNKPNAFDLLEQKNLVLYKTNMINKIIYISQNVTIKNIRSNVAIFIGIFEYISNLYAKVPEAKNQGYQKKHFYFNSKKGQCSYCLGLGINEILMNFSRKIKKICEQCQGEKFNNDILKIKYKNKNIADILKMTINIAFDFFSNHVIIRQRLIMFKDIGLGYLTLGQLVNSLSGGEIQRLKLAIELSKQSNSKTIYILDEPTVGLHSEDIQKLINIIKKIIKNRSTIITVEHNLDIIKNADYIIDLGPEGGQKGGEIIAQGTPEEISCNPQSYTGQYLRQILMYLSESER
ncbi:MAG: excinuclease ABC subunit UvrA [Vigna little leaf phytoplasma]|nr:excinuclease ABC subunit UvrA [Vigna little leaf phytoplasma]